MIPPGEAWRKTIHMSGALAPPFGYVLVGWTASLSVLVFVLAYVSLAGLLSLRGKSLPIAGGLLRRAGRRDERFPVEPLQYGLALLALLMLFQEPVAFAAIGVLALGDGVASLAGRRWGRRRLPWNHKKTIAGLVGGFGAAIAAGLGFSLLGRQIQEARLAESPVLPLEPVLVLVSLGAGYFVALAVSRIPLLRETGPRPIAPRLWVTAVAFGCSLASAAVPLALTEAGVLRGPLLGAVPAAPALVVVALAATAAMLVESVVRRHDNLWLPAAYVAVLWLASALSG